MIKGRLAFLKFPRRALLFVFVFVSSASAWAGTYQLVSGNGKDVCEAYRRNFEPRHDPEPMACERHYDPGIPEFTKPVWTELNLKKHFDLYRKAQVYLLQNDNSPEGMKLSNAEIREVAENLEPRAKTWHVQLYLARLDLARDGRLFNVLMVTRHGCGPNAFPDDKITTSDLFLLNDSLTDIDHDRQDSTNGWLDHASIELYKGKPYIEAYVADDGWRHLLTGNGILSVHQYTRAAQIAREFPQAEVSGDAPLVICKIQYLQNSPDNK